MDAREAAKAVVAALVEAYNSKDADALARIYADDVRLWSTLGAEVVGADAVLEHVRELFRILPDETMTADVVVGDGETVVAEFTSRGTDSRGTPYELRFTEVFEVVDGRVAAISTYVDPDDVARIAVHGPGT